MRALRFARNPILVCLKALILALLLLDLSCHQNSQPATNTKEIVESNVKLQVSMPTKAREGEKIILLGDFTNLREKEVAFIPRLNNIRYLLISITNDKGERPKKTALGEANSGLDDPLIHIGSMKYILLQPRDSYRWQIDLTKNFILPQGEYELTLAAALDDPTVPFIVSIRGIKFSVENANP